MPGGGINAANVTLFASCLPLTEIHASCAVPMPPAADPRITRFGFQAVGARQTDAGKVRALRDALDQISASRPSGWTSS
jgi:copper homeostasis protein